MRRPRRGGWVPLLPLPWRMAVMAMIPITPVLLGVDYLMGESGSTLTEVEKAMPLDVWGWLLIVSGSAVFLGFGMRWRLVTIGALWVSGAVLLTLAAGIGAETIDWGGGFRGPWLYAAFGLASWLTAGGYIAMKDGGTRGPE